MIFDRTIEAMDAHSIHNTMDIHKAIDSIGVIDVHRIYKTPKAIEVHSFNKTIKIIQTIDAIGMHNIHRIHKINRSYNPIETMQSNRLNSIYNSHSIYNTICSL